MSAQMENFQGAGITENELSETVWDFTFRLLASFQKVDFFFGWRGSSLGVAEF